MAWVFRLPKEVQSSVDKFRFEGMPSALAMKGFSVKNDGLGTIVIRSLGSSTLYVRRCARCYAMQLCVRGCDAFVTHCVNRDYDVDLAAMWVESALAP